MAGPDLDTISSVDALVDGLTVVTNIPCTEIHSKADLEAFRGEVNGAIYEALEGAIDNGETVMVGHNCGDVQLPPKIPKGCEIDGPIPVDSYARMRGNDAIGSVFQINGKGVNVKHGKVLYEAVKGVCELYPEMAVKVMGLEIVPVGKQGYTRALAQVEKGDFDAVQVRIHIYDGAAVIRSTSGTKFIEMAQNTDYTINPETFKKLVRYNFNSFQEGVDSLEKPQVVNPEHANNGCAGVPGPIDFTTLIVAMTLFATYKSIRMSFSRVPALFEKFEEEEDSFQE